VASLIGERVRFLHVPKTGGSWATDAMFAGGVKADRPADVPFHGALAETAGYSDRFTLAIVRHPLDMWRSYWAYRNRTGWLEDHPIDRVAASENLDEFTRLLVEVAPGHTGELFTQFVGPPGNEIDFICRHERLADDLCAALRLAGEPFDERALRAHPPVNTSEYSSRSALYSRQTAELLAESERNAIERFYPWEPMPQHLLLDPVAGRSNDRVARQLETAEISRRDAAAELRVLRGREAARERHIEQLEQRLDRAELALAELRSSRLVRWSRAPRIAWYELRRGD
jgi:hypothetical protein